MPQVSFQETSRCVVQIVGCPVFFFDKKSTIEANLDLNRFEYECLLRTGAKPVLKRTYLGQTFMTFCFLIFIFINISTIITGIN